MDSARILVTLGGAGLIGFTLRFFFGGREAKEPVQTALDSPLYQCPMHPWITSPHPGSCSVCGMELQRGQGVGAGAAGTNGP